VLSRAIDYFSYLVFRVAEGIMGVLPLGLIARVGSVIGVVLYYLAWPYRGLVLRNLEIAFGKEMSGAQRRVVARRHFASLIANLFCGLKLPLMREADILKRVRMEGSEHAHAVIAQGKPLLWAVTHLSCWELLTQVPSLVAFGLKPATIYQPLSNPHIDAHVHRRRAKLGYAVFDRSQGFAGPMKFLRSGQAALGVLVDQHAGDVGVWCPFFDRLASTTSLPALMAIRCKAPLIPLAVYDDGPGRWRMKAFPAVDSGEPTPTAEGITAALNQSVERMVRESPHNAFWVHNRWKTPMPQFLLTNYKRGITLPQGYDAGRLQRFELIVRSPNWLGDACMALPAVRALRHSRPDLRLTIHTPANLAQLWEAQGIADAIVTKDKHDGLFTAARKIKATGRRYDAGILFTNSPRSTFEFKLAGVPHLAGFHGSLRAGLLEITAPEPPLGPPEHQARRYLRLVGHCGAMIDDPALLSPQRDPLPADALVKVGIVAGAEYGPAKRWPLERYAAVANALPAVQWQLFGAPGEAAMGEKLAAMVTSPCENSVGKTTMHELIAALRCCTLLLTNDTGSMHLAAALGVPTVSIFGSTEPILTGPLGAGHRIVRHHVACSPCFKRECPFGHYDCMTGVSVERVVSAVREALA
jgi:heptosyltransferase II